MKIKKSLKKLVAIICVPIVFFILLFLAGLSVFYYNYNLSPPAKLKNNINIDQEYSQVIVLFNEYQQKYKDNKDVSISKGETDELSTRNPDIPEGRYIHLYHWILFDDIQLTVYFDKNDIVKHIEFVGD